LWIGLAGRNDANKVIFNVEMHHKQKSKTKVTTHCSFSLFLVSRGILVLDERIKEYLCGLLKRNAVVILYV
jgi:hypothetical protein